MVRQGFPHNAGKALILRDDTPSFPPLQRVQL